VADAYPDTADSLAELLRVWGHRPVVAYDGHSALDLYAAHRPRVVVLDMLLGGPGGCEVARHLRRDYPEDLALIVAVSTLGGEAERRNAVEAGMDLYFAKPLDLGRLRQLLDEVAVWASGPRGLGTCSVGLQSFSPTG
jgi:CheY-like chemotaxis protein